jgi:hypothetical protein
VLKPNKCKSLLFITFLKSSDSLTHPVHTVSDVKQIEIHTTEPLVPDPSLSEVEIATGKLKRYKSPGSDQIPAELIQAGGEILHSKTHKLINSVRN